MLGNTTYLYTPYSGAFNYFVDDKGGVDFLDLRGYWQDYNLLVDLRPGALSTLAQRQHLTTTTNPYNLIENVYGGLGDDKIIGNWFSNIINGNNGNDSLYGEGGNDALDGWNGRDLISGGSGKDFLDGTQDDTIYGGDGNDTIFDGINQDVLYGGSGFDTFIFRDMTIRDSKGISYYDSEESSLSRPDYIMGFANPGDLYGDRIDLSKVDAWPDGDRDPLSFGGYVGFTGVNAGPGTIVLGQEVTNTVVYGNVGFNFGDSNRDFKIVIVDDGISYTQYNANDFLV